MILSRSFHKALLAGIMALLCAAVFILPGCSVQTQAPEKAIGITVHVIDVGQGDAILISSSRENVLVDTGDVPDRDKLVSYIKKQGISTIDKVIITHPHADHLGGMPAVLEHFTVKQLYDSGQTTTTGLYRRYLTTVKDKKIPFSILTGGQTLELGDGAVLHILSPGKPYFDGPDALNNNSIVAKLVYGNFSMLLTGDAEQEAEQKLVKLYGEDLHSTVLKSGHHGSNTSSSSSFLKQVRPEVAVISVGAGNEYHHPHPSTLKKYGAMKSKVYRTDRDGTITIYSDGQSYQVRKEKNNQ
ncbi:hypothetical protein P22_2375 [Propionispora sp. 2/2-37]|uniref:ComEC/Rec2 family competence protein n=1 Tax=Propionispora sp. 2/2-37 TaxID=1677858 RepID=UPI0006BB66C0|nr:ComEC/Rec2 family competence protein [Propionispora sp. 2/2-37]CUH96285.1 hypothetical protein P22_2375 [Propionispora sp. 2/2-37]